MNEQELDELMKSVGPTYRADGEPPLDRMWSKIEARAFAAPVVPIRPSRWPRFLALAATLVLGVGIGFAGGRRWAVPTPVTRDLPAGPTDLVPASTGADGSPFVGLARDYIQQSTALVLAIAGDLKTGRLLPATVSRARELLSTTRLLLDRDLPDPAVRDLLEDLELLLAQVVRTPENANPTTDAQLIADAMDQRAVLPRLSLMLADATAP